LKRISKEVNKSIIFEETLFSDTILFGLGMTKKPVLAGRVVKMVGTHRPTHPTIGSGRAKKPNLRLGDTLNPTHLRLDPPRLNSSWVELTHLQITTNLTHLDYYVKMKSFCHFSKFLLIYLYDYQITLDIWLAFHPWKIFSSLSICRVVCRCESQVGDLTIIFYFLTHEI